MKNRKKIFALLLAMIMIFAMSVTAFAEGETYTITAPTTNHQYEIYQIFTGDLSEGTLSNVKWGTNGTGENGKAVSPEILKELEEISNTATDQQKLEVITKYADLSSNPLSTITNGETYNAAPGYYLIKDKDDSVTGEDAYTTYIVKVVGDVTIVPKSDVPSSEKKVKDINDSEGEQTNWQDSADYDVGDEIPYQISATLPDDVNAFEAYKTYFLNFVDDMSEGLTYKDGSSVVKVNGTQVATLEPTVDSEATSAYNNGIVYRWNINDIKASPYNAKAGDVITIEYIATLNSKAVLGSAGNPNKMHIEFDNNPNTEGDGDKGTTPDDVNIVFTYKVVVNKVDEEGKPLEGAGFTLYKKNDQGEYVAVGDELKGNEMTTFTWNRLDDGDYKLVETTTPSGKNTIDPIEFKITAEHEIVSDNPTLTSLNGNVTSGEAEFTTSVSDGSLTTDVVNESGSTLPSTGGMGTTIFYIVGAILVLGAGLLLITRRRMNA